MTILQSDQGLGESSMTEGVLVLEFHPLHKGRMPFSRILKMDDFGHTICVDSRRPIARIYQCAGRRRESDVLGCMCF